MLVPLDPDGLRAALDDPAAEPRDYDRSVVAMILLAAVGAVFALTIVAQLPTVTV